MTVEFEADSAMVTDGSPTQAFKSFPPYKSRYSTRHKNGIIQENEKSYWSSKLNKLP